MIGRWYRKWIHSINHRTSCGLVKVISHVWWCLSSFRLNKPSMKCIFVSLISKIQFAPHIFALSSSFVDRMNNEDLIGDCCISILRFSAELPSQTAIENRTEYSVVSVRIKLPLLLWLVWLFTTFSWLIEAFSILVRNLNNFPGISQDFKFCVIYLTLTSICHNCLELFGTVWNYSELLWTAQNISSSSSMFVVITGSCIVNATECLFHSTFLIEFDLRTQIDFILSHILQLL
jgi:hypothetical protein